MPPNLSISDKAFDRSALNVAENLQAFASHGFTHIHFSHRWKKEPILPAAEVAEWVEALAAAGLKVLDTHGPGPAIWHEDAGKRDHADRCFRDRLQLTARLGGDAMVYHVPTGRPPEPAVIRRFLEGLARMEETARELGVVVALENHFSAEMDRHALPAAFAHFDPAYIGFTLDTGHGNRSGNLSWLLQHCCQRLAVLHLNDNDGKKDRHWLPSDPDGTVPWEDVAGAIAGSPYAKPLQLEVRWHAAREASHGAFLAQAREDLRAVEEKVAAYGGAPAAR